MYIVSVIFQGQKIISAGRKSWACGRLLLFLRSKQICGRLIMNRSRISSVDSEAIAQLRLPLAIAVVFIHVGMGFTGTGICWSAPTGMDWYRFAGCLIVNELAGMAVPLFFMISGYLFFVGSGQMEERRWWPVYGQKLKRRVRTLLIPYIIYNILAAVGLIVNHVLSGHTLMQALDLYMGHWHWLRNFWDVHTVGTSTNVLGITKAVAYPLNGPLWFVRDLMMVMLLAPIVRLAIRYLRWGWLVLMVALALMGIWIPLPGFGVSSCLFFSMGAWFACTGLSMGESLAKWRWVLLGVALPAMIGDVVADGTDYDKYLHLLALMSGILCVFAFVAKAQVKWRVPGWSGQAAFFLFATHTLPIAGLGARPVEWCKGLIWTNCNDALFCFVQFMATGLLTAAMCLAAFLLLRLVCPRFLDFTTGRD